MDQLQPPFDVTGEGNRQLQAATQQFGDYKPALSDIEDAMFYTSVEEGFSSEETTLILRWFKKTYMGERQ